MNVTAARSLLDQLDGATIVSSYIEDEEGLHLCLQDGRVLIIAGMFVLGLTRIERQDLH